MVRYWKENVRELESHAPSTYPKNNLDTMAIQSLKTPIFHQSPTRHSDYTDNDSVATIDNCRQHGDYTVIDS